MTIDTSTPAALYARNPDVVLREEDEDGALLFNPDTNQVRVLNTTGLFVWNLCDGTRDLPGIAAAICASFDHVPEGKVDDQVAEYIEDMLRAGFIGTLVD